MTQEEITVTDGDEREVCVPLEPEKPVYCKRQSCKKLFNKIDANGDGVISKCEYSTFFKNTFTPKELEKIFQRADTNKDGQLSYKEFVKIFCRVYGRRYVNFVVAAPKTAGEREEKVLEVVVVEDFEEEEEDEEVELYDVDWSCSPSKLGMITISVLQIMFFLLDEYFLKKAIKDNFKFSSCSRHQIWRFLTYSLVHSSTLHLSANVIIQLFFGIPLEMYHGWWRILSIYLSGVITGSLLTSILDPAQKLVGASGGVYALITAHIANIIMNWSQLRRGTYPGLQLFILLTISTTDLITSIYERYGIGIDLHVGYVAHLAGAVAGLLVGIGILRNIKIMQHENVIWWLAAILYGVLVLGAILWNVFYFEHFSKYCE